MSSVTIPTITTSEAIESTPSAAANNITVFHAFLTQPLYGEVIAQTFASGITPNTDVLVSISEVDSQNNPFMGAARLTVHNVVPGTNEIHVWVRIEWNQPINVRFSFYVSR